MPVKLLSTCQCDKGRVHEVLCPACAPPKEALAQFIAAGEIEDCRKEGER